MKVKTDEKVTTARAEKRKGFFGRILDSLDRKLEKKAREASCCAGSKKDKGSRC
ncbi:MAG: hypothetical protein AAB229_08240 [Candidatus Hydrogenedentota bacterium]